MENKFPMIIELLAKHKLSCGKSALAIKKGKVHSILIQGLMAI
jgi:hypothetical protein